MRRASYLGVFFFTLLSIPALVVRAQWASDSVTNTPVCTTLGLQDHPQLCTDDSDGAIIVWEDARSNGYRVYAQRLNAAGHTLWTSNGVLLSNGTGDQKNPVIASDGAGGAYVVWEDYRNTLNGIDLYAQHILSSGLLGYGTSGAAVCTDPRNQNNAAITSDGHGNSYVAWEDNRNTTTNSQPDIYLNRLTPAGVQWTVDGLAISTQPGLQRHLAICNDGTGGCYMAWESSETVPTSIFAQRVDSNETLHWTQSQGGLDVYQASQGTETSSDVSIARDGNDLLLAWETTDYSTSNGQDIYAQRISASGAKVYSPAVAVTGEWFGDQTNPQIFPDDSLEIGSYPTNGMIVLFDNNYGYTPQTVDMVRMFSDGTDRIPTEANGFFQISYTQAAASGFKAVPIGSGSVMAAWNDSRGDTTIFAQRVDRVLRRYFPAMGTQSTWGLPVCHRSTSSRQVALAPRTNGAIAAWTDFRNGQSNPDIYAQLIFQDGSLPVELSSFTLERASGNEVDVAWQTASEQACAGFEIERRELSDTASNSYTLVASYKTTSGLTGAGTSTTARNYFYRDLTADAATYEYQLTEISLDGTRHAYGPKTIEGATPLDLGQWELGINEPNPFTTSTIIPFTLASNAAVKLDVYDNSGRRVASLVAGEVFSAGAHSALLDGHALPNGSFFVRMTCTDPATGELLWQSMKPLTIAHLQ